MGLDLHQVYRIHSFLCWRDVAALTQHMGRAGRDRTQSYVYAHVDRAWLSGTTLGESLREFLFGTTCLRVVIAKHFDPATDVKAIHQQQLVQHGSEPEAAQMCCCVCRARNTRHPCPNINASADIVRERTNI